eukprot:7374078-Heterocapsa_arctica.AAC.1
MFSKSSVRATRIANYKKRMPRVSRLRKGGSAKASRRIFATGLSPATQYGSEGYGLSDLEVKAIQSLLLSCLNPMAAG